MSEVSSISSITTDDASYLKDINNRPDIDNEEMTIGEMTELYAGLREELKKERRAFKDIENSIKFELDHLEGSILEAQRKLGIRSISTGNYTAFQTEKKYVRMGDWDTFSKYVLKSGNVHLLEKRPAKLANLELEEFGVDLSTIGLEKTTEVCIQVRKK
jgi:hypothetical protein